MSVREKLKKHLKEKELSHSDFVECSLVLWPVSVSYCIYGIGMFV